MLEEKRKQSIGSLHKVEAATLRAILVEGIVKNQFVFGLNVITTSLAVRYLDRFLGSNRFDVQPVQGWVYHLVANACQTIAVKFQETVRVDNETIQRHVDIAFDRVCVLKMESLVLKELAWSLNSVVPHTYIPRLLTLLGFQGEEFSRLLGRSHVYALSILYDVNFVRWAPSVVVRKPNHRDTDGRKTSSPPPPPP